MSWFRLIKTTVIILASMLTTCACWHIFIMTMDQKVLTALLFLIVYDVVWSQFERSSLSIFHIED